MRTASIGADSWCAWPPRGTQVGESWHRGVSITHWHRKAAAPTNGDYANKWSYLNHPRTLPRPMESRPFRRPGSGHPRCTIQTAKNANRKNKKNSAELLNPRNPRNPRKPSHPSGRRDACDVIGQLPFCERVFGQTVVDRRDRNCCGEHSDEGGGYKQHRGSISP